MHEINASRCSYAAIFIYTLGEEGHWIRRLDIVQAKQKTKDGSYGTTLSLKEPGGIAKCTKECYTIARSCRDMFDEELDRDELSTILYNNKLTASQVQEKVRRQKNRFEIIAYPTHLCCP